MMIGSSGHRIIGSFKASSGLDQWVVGPGGEPICFRLSNELFRNQSIFCKKPAECVRSRPIGAFSCKKQDLRVHIL